MMLRVAAALAPPFECALARPAVIAATATMATTENAARLLRQTFMRLLRLEFEPWGGQRCDNVTTCGCTSQGALCKAAGSDEGRGGAGGAPQDQGRLQA